ncbi:hypothetical protein CTI12_AA241090 [Artemisia annua]|uniref:YbeD-like domain-containing protein n=1 Tax=Artemisia annua TaxID=35608 RepID=A0A2U1N8J3_ARTAN|nr:hypothetical protein CTI12_AA241090 [Artemisia annua]
MASSSRMVLRTLMLTEPWLLLPPSTRGTSVSLSKTLTSNSTCRCKIRSTNVRRICHTRINCLNDENDNDGDVEPPQEAVLKVISEVSKTEGRVGQTTNMVLGGTVTDDATDEWLTLDQKVNTYPTVRGFTAIGTGGDDFVQAMVVAVESVLQHQIPQGQVKQKMSSGGKYVSVNIGPVQVVSSEQVQAVYNAMKSDERMKYFL